jgi:hypothetical protein
MEVAMKYDALLAEFRAGPKKLKDRIEGLSEENLRYKPSEDTWSIQEHVVHIVDSEINNFIRWKSIFAQPRSQIFVIDEENWTRNLENRDVNVKAYLEVFEKLREIAYDYLKDVDEADWNREYFVHKKLGNVHLERCIQTYTNHVPFHLEYIEKILAERKQGR